MILTENILSMDWYTKFGDNIENIPNKALFLKGMFNLYAYKLNKYENWDFDIWSYPIP